MSQKTPLWTPSEQRKGSTNLRRFMQSVESNNAGGRRFDDYGVLYRWSIDRPAEFWSQVWDFCGVIAGGNREPVLVDGNKMPGAHWFPNVRLNFAQNLLRFQDDSPALIFRNEWGHRREYSYAQLRASVGRVAWALKRAGIQEGDRVAGYLPNIPEAVIAMLATTSLGAIWSSASPDFGLNGVVDRFGQIEPRVLFCADAYAYGGKHFDCLAKVRDVLKAVPSIEKCVVIAYSGDVLKLDGLRDTRSWDDFAGDEERPIGFVPTAFEHPAYILYSSGTTGKPKCIVHGAGGVLLQHLKELVLHVDLKREDRVFYYTTCGWMMWNWLVSSLAVGATLVLYDGSPTYPDGNVLWNLADEVGITVFGTSAKWLDATSKMGLRPRETHQLAGLKALLSTGSPLQPETFDYVYRDVKADLQLASISGGTDIVSCFALGNPLLPVWRGEIQGPGLGLEVRILDDAGRPVRGRPGELACTAPFPAMPVCFWNDPGGQRYRDAYFSKLPGVWCHGDLAELTGHDGIIIYGRSDTTLNPGGVRIGTAEIYRQVEQIPEILESVAVGQRWDGSERIVLFVRLRAGVKLDDELRDRIRQRLRENATPRSGAHPAGRGHPAHAVGENLGSGGTRRDQRRTRKKHGRARQSASPECLRLAASTAGHLISTSAEQCHWWPQASRTHWPPVSAAPLFPCPPIKVGSLRKGRSGS